MNTLNCLVVCLTLGTALGLASDEIKSLPGLKEKPNFRQYSGYLNGGKDIHIHYWFVESQSNPAKDPVLLWLQGGPGVSSLFALFTENGPFRVAPDNTTVTIDRHSWNTLANVLYLESPVGVGYSWTANTSYCDTDDSSAQVNYLALEDFFTKFPQFSKNSFYITGESYAGIFIPLLAIEILKNKKSAEVPIDLKGMAIGNGYLDPKLLLKTEVQYRVAHGLSPIQDPAYSSADHTMNQYASYNDYNIYDDRPVCKSKMQYVASIFEGKYGKDSANLVNSLNDCVSEGYQEYMNARDVRQALHIADKLEPWYEISNHICYHEQYDTMKPQIQELVEKYKLDTIIIYNGDFDTVCNFIGGQKFVDNLGYQVIDEYHSWTSGQRIGGWVKRYKGITFTTVRAAGHMVPTDQPEAALEIVKELIGKSKLR